MRQASGVFNGDRRRFATSPGASSVALELLSFLGVRPLGNPCAPGALRKLIGKEGQCITLREI
ncbi:hypothetical protein CWO90_12085 [Bradyrhizobium sp. Leo121]|nr:hypothetical protein CWO90_12085 [Bradyrhizobium sp. Leo121]